MRTRPGIGWTGPGAWLRCGRPLGPASLWALLALWSTTAAAEPPREVGEPGTTEARGGGPLRSVMRATPAVDTGTAGPAGVVSNGLIQSATLDPAVPLFVPTHARVTTTLRFPGAIGAPEGRGFTEDEAKSPGEYLVAWTRGEPHLTVTPLAGAAALNMNIPYEGNTYVVYFYPVERQFQALASLRLVKPGTEAARPQGRHATGPSHPPPRPDSVEPVLLLGLLDKIKLLRAVAPGTAQQRLATTLGLELHCAERPPERNAGEPGDGKELSCEITHVARDASLGVLAFVLRLRNSSEQAQTLAGAEMAVLCGSSRLCGRLQDAPGLLAPREEAEAFVLVQQAPLVPLSAANSWKASLEVPRAQQADLGRTGSPPETEALQKDRREGSEGLRTASGGGRP